MKLIGQVEKKIKPQNTLYLVSLCVKMQGKKEKKEKEKS